MSSVDAVFHYLGQSQQEIDKTVVRVIVDDQVKSIGSFVFRGCTSLTSIELPDGLEEIGFGAFEGCTSLESINLPDGLKEIGPRAFHSCESLTSIKLPDGLKEIGVIDLEKHITLISGGKLPNGEGTFAGCTSLTSIELPNGLKEIGVGTFTGCTSLTSIELPDGLKEIGEGTFANYTSLTSIKLPDGLEKIGPRAFESCSSLTSIKLPDGLKEIEDSAFKECTSLTSIELPNGLKAIDLSSFKSCTKLTFIKLPDGLKVIGEGAFVGCESLTSIELPNGLKVIGEGAFVGCESLTSIELPNGLEEIKKGAFFKCTSLTSVKLPDGLKVIGEGVFARCKSLTSIKLPDGLEKIDEVAFLGCESLTSINLPGGLKQESIGSDAFKECNRLLPPHMQNQSNEKILVYLRESYEQKDPVMKNIMSGKKNFEDIFTSEEDLKDISISKLEDWDNQLVETDPNSPGVYGTKTKEGGVLLHEVAKYGLPLIVLEHIIENTSKNRKDMYEETPFIKATKNRWKEHKKDQLKAIFRLMKDVHPECFNPVTDKPNLQALYQFGFIPFPQFKERTCKLLVGCIDIAGFKAVNDSFNHQVGDAALKYYAEEMQSKADEINSVGYKIPSQKEGGLTVAHVYHKSGDEFFVLFQFEEDKVKETLYEKWCKEKFGKLTWDKEKDKENNKEKDTTGRKVCTFLRLGCLWSKGLPDCSEFFKDYGGQPIDEKFQKLKDEQLKECGKFFQEKLMNKSDELEIEVKEKIKKEVTDIPRGESISKKYLDMVLNGSLNVSVLKEVV